MKDRGEDAMRARELIRIRVRGLCTGPIDGTPGGVSSPDNKTWCCTCGKRVRVIFRVTDRRARFAHHKARPKAKLKLVKVGRREYQTEDGRYRVYWDRRQGARSVWVVVDKQSYRQSLRADTLTDARVTLREMRQSEPSSELDNEGQR